MSNTESASKARSFTFLVYPSSAPKDWKEQLRESHLMFGISPLHKPDDEHTKPHHHVIFYTASPITLQAAKRKIPASVPANGFIEPVADFKVMCRYFLHLDNPEKQQFKGDPYDLVECINGFPLDVTRELSTSELEAIEDDVMDYVRDNNVTEFAELCYSLKDAGKREMYTYAKNHAYLFGQVVKSQRYILARECQPPQRDLESSQISDDKKGIEDDET